jgi:hypothetical protein
MTTNLHWHPVESTKEVPLICTFCHFPIEPGLCWHIHEEEQHGVWTVISAIRFAHVHCTGAAPADAVQLMSEVMAKWQAPPNQNNS